MISLPKTISLIFLSLASFAHSGIEDFEPEKKLTQQDITLLLKKKSTHSKQLARDQDELSADVQEMIEAQTDTKVINLLQQVEELMAGVTDNLMVTETGKDTLYKENLIIEKIFEAAKQKGRGKGKSQQEMKKMFEQLEKMMKGEEASEKPGQKPGDKAGNGGPTGSTDLKNAEFQSDQGKSSIRRLPKKGGIKASNLPSEYRHVIEAYNKNQPNQ